MKTCLFCRQPLTLKPYGTPYTSADRETTQCAPCRVSYIHDGQGQLYYYEFSGFFSGKQYIASFRVHNQQFTLYAPPPLSSNSVQVAVLSLDYLPNISPISFDSKLKTLLVFS